MFDLTSDLGKNMRTSPFYQKDFIKGPNGDPLSLDSLPPTDTKRWVVRRKAEVVAAVRGGLLTLEEACDRYTLSVEEFITWQNSIEKNGIPGLRVTRTQKYRKP